nr:hypothetical protein [Tanacetum cinerariifolium]
MEWLPKCEELEKVVGVCNWLDMMIVYFDEYAYEQREFACRVNRLISEMNEVCADRMAFVRELQSVAGETVPAKSVAFLEEMMNKEALPIRDELRRTVSSPDWEPQFILYCERAKSDDVRLARQINALCDTLTEVINERWSFIRELDMLAYKFVPGKMAKFMKEMQDKDISNLMKLQILGREFELRACEKDLFI